MNILNSNYNSTITKSTYNELDEDINVFLQTNKEVDIVQRFTRYDTDIIVRTFIVRL